LSRDLPEVIVSLDRKVTRTALSLNAIFASRVNP
jgi:hypothetical protein